MEKMKTKDLFKTFKKMEDLKEDYIKFIDEYTTLCNDFVKVCEENETLAAENARLVLSKVEKDVEIVDLIEERAKLNAEIERLKKKVDFAIQLPCRIGDIVYKNIVQTDSYSGLPYNIVSACNFRIDMLDKIGKTVFLTKEEADAKLKGTK